MQDITNFAHPIELSNEELDLVAAAGGHGCGCRDGGDENTAQAGLINLNHTNVGVNILGNQFQSAG